MPPPPSSSPRAASRYSESVLTAPQVLRGEVEPKNGRVLVVGSGLTGLETVEKLNELGNRVTVVEMAEQIAPGAWFQFVDDSLARIRPFGTEFLLGTRLERIDGRSVTISADGGRRKKILHFDCIVLAMGVRPNRALAGALEEQGIATVTVGDAVAGGTIGAAVHSAFDAAMCVRV